MSAEISKLGFVDRMRAFLKAWRIPLYAILAAVLAFVAYQYIWYLGAILGIVSTVFVGMWWFRILPEPATRMFNGINRYLHLEVIAGRVRDNRRWLYCVLAFLAAVLAWATFVFMYDSTLTAVVTVLGGVLVLAGVSYWIMADRGYVTAIGLLVLGLALITARPIWLYEASAQTACEVVTNTEDKPGEHEHVTVNPERRVVLDAPWFNLGARGDVEIYEHSKVPMSLYKQAPTDFARIHQMAKPLVCMVSVNGISLQWLSSDTRRVITGTPDCVLPSEVAQQLPQCADVNVTGLNLKELQAD